MRITNISSLIFKKNYGYLDQEWWYMPIILPLGRLRKED
jgi:hypothetical protein